MGVKGQVDSYKGELQLNVHYLETVEGLRYRGRDLMSMTRNCSSRPPRMTASNCGRNCGNWPKPRSTRPLDRWSSSSWTTTGRSSWSAPRPCLYHHPYLGGLLEHTWFVTRHALASLAIYPELNRDLVLAGAILHDLGKIKELANPPAPEPTVPGHLLGHIVLGWEMVRAEAQALEFPDPTLLLQLEHIILSHHGVHGVRLPYPPQDPGGPAGKFSG